MALLARLRRKRVFDELDDVGVIDRLKSLYLAVEPIPFVVRSDQLETEIDARLVLDMNGCFLFASSPW